MRDFHLGDILSVTTGILVAPRHMDGLYELLNYMTGDNLFTHQLMRASDECKTHLLAQHPQLAEVQPGEMAAEAVTPWLTEQVARFGEYLAVTPLAPQDHTRIDPIAEFRMAYPNTPITPVVMDR